MNAPDDDFNKLDEMFYRIVLDFNENEEKMRQIRSLKWDFNPISTYFISFLSMQTKLNTLSISGCFCPRDSNRFDDFCSFLESSTSLERLICRRFNKIILESLTTKLIRAVANSCVKYLDISNSRGGEKCYRCLMSLMSNNEARTQSRPRVNRLNLNKENCLNLSNEVDLSLDNKFNLNLSNENFKFYLNSNKENNLNQSYKFSSNQRNESNLNSCNKLNLNQCNENNLNNKIDLNSNNENNLNNKIGLNSGNENNLNNKIGLNSNNENNLNNKIGLNSNNENNLNNKIGLSSNNENDLNNKVSFDENDSLNPNEDDLNHESIQHEDLNQSNKKSSFSSLKYVIYDGMRPVNKEHLIEFIEFIRKNELGCSFSFPIHDIEYLFKKQKIGLDGITALINLCLLKKESEDYIKPFTVFYKENQNNFPFYFKEENEKVRSEFIQPSETSNENYKFCEKNEVKTGNFFGVYHEKINSISIDSNESCIFSFNSDDDDEYDETNELSSVTYNGDNRSQKSKKFQMMNKHPNSKKSELFYLSKPPNKTDGEFNCRCDEKDDDVAGDGDDDNGLNKSDTMKNEVISDSGGYNYSDSKDGYEYSDEDDDNIVIIKPIQSKSVLLNKNRKVPLLRSLFQRKIFFNQSLKNNNVIKKKVFQINLDDESSSYDSYSYYSYDSVDEANEK